jgi:hypothetical protein
MQRFCKNFNCEYEQVEFTHKCKLFVCKNCPMWKFVNKNTNKAFYTTADLYWHRFEHLPRKKRKIYSY